MSELPGWSAHWAGLARAADSTGAWQPVRVVAEHRGAYRALGKALEGAGTATGWIELTGRSYNRALDKRALPTVGDWVLVERWAAAVAETGAAMVRTVLPRQSFLVRKAAGEATAPQPVAANVDVGFVLTSANSDLSAARLDRYISLLRDGHIEPVLVLSKVDLVGDVTATLDALAKVADVRIVSLSATSGTGLDVLRGMGGPGKTCVMLGSSGVGKSTLLNALIGTRQVTREIRADDRGRHTTTHRELFVADDGSAWIDTPGMRELAQWIDDAAAEEQAFDDITALAANCKFRDCKHAHEPGCGVRDAVAVERLASFHKLSAERAAAAARQDKAAKLAESRKARQRVPKPPREE